VVGWLRNVPRKSWAFTVPYKYDGNDTPMYPDFLSFRKQGDGIVVDILEPHATSQDDSWAKAVGLADFAVRHGDRCGRIEIIIKEKEKLIRLDVNKESVRDKARKVSNNTRLRELFASDGSLGLGGQFHRLPERSERHAAKGTRDWCDAEKCDLLWRLRRDAPRRVQNGYVSACTRGHGCPLHALKKCPVSSKNVSAHAREWTPVPHSSFPRNEGVRGSNPRVGSFIHPPSPLSRGVREVCVKPMCQVDTGRAPQALWDA